MKRVLSLILTVIIALSLCACGGSNNEEKKPAGLQVGFGKVDITPNFSISLYGYGDYANRLSEGVVAKIYATCIAMSENDQTVLLYTLDLGACHNGLADTLRIKVSAETGIPKENLFFAATHTHSAPQAAVSNATGVELRYQQLLATATVDAAKEALADMASATILSAQPEIEGMNFVRHYKMTDGTYAGSNFGTFTNKEIEGHATEGDHKMTLVKFDRPEGKEDILLVNWAAHPDHGNTIGRKNISPDYPGFMRDKIEAETGMKVAFFSGASGNMNPNSKIAEEKHGLDVKAYGEKLADLAVAALPTLAPVEGTGVKVAPVADVTLDVDHTWDHMVKEAEEVQNASNAEYARLLCQQYDFSSDIHAGAIIRRSKAAKTGEVPLRAFSVGGIGFVNYQHEMFSENGMYIKENSPFAVTIIATANYLYMASEAAYDYRSYEADTGNFVKGSSEKLSEKFVEMLKSLA